MHQTHLMPTYMYTHTTCASHTETHTGCECVCIRGGGRVIRHLKGLE